MKYFPNLYADAKEPRFTLDYLSWSPMWTNWSENLEISFEEVEIYKVIADLDCLKPPGRDGMASEFMKKAWNILKSDLVGV